MVTRRVATAAVLLVLIGAACGTNSTARVAAHGAIGGDANAAAPTTVTTVSPPSTTSTTVPADPTPAAIAVTAPPRAATTPGRVDPAPSSIQIDYQPSDGATATATIDGPTGAHSASLAGGGAMFNDVAEGIYSITITVDSAPVTAGDGTGVDTARQIINGGNISLSAGQNAVISCDDNGCTATL